MRFLFATDTHATGKGPSSRIDSYPLAVKRKLAELSAVAQKLDVDAVIHGGDLFDKPIVSLQLTGEIADIIRSSGKPWYVVPGNHDLFGYNIASLPQTSLGFLAKAGIVTILDRQAGPLTFTWFGKSISFEGQEYSMDIDNRDPAMDYYVTSQADYKVLVPHSMLLDNPYFPDTHYTLTQDLQGITDADLILVGHYHDGYDEVVLQGISRPLRIINPGSMLRDEASKGNMKRKPKYLVLDYDPVMNTMEVTHKTFKLAEPGKDVFDRSHIEAKTQKNYYLQSFERKLSDEAITSVDVRNVLNTLAATQGNIDQVVLTMAHHFIDSAEKTLDDVALQMANYLEKPNNIWISKIEIKGFQSHEDTVIDLSKKFNAIIGPSDSGKSAIIRAIRFAIYNEPRGSDFVRQSSNEAFVRLHFNDGSYIERSRTRDSAGTYIVGNGQGTVKHLKGFSNNIPVDVPNVHQMPKIQLTKDMETSLNISFQLDPPFLIGESPGTRASIIGKLTGANLVDAAIRELNKEILNDSKSLKLYVEQYDTITNRLADYNDLPTLKSDIDLLTQTIQELEDLESEETKLVDIANKHRSLTHQQVILSNQLVQLPKTDQADVLVKEIEGVQAKLKKYERLRSTHLEMIRNEMIYSTETGLITAIRQQANSHVMTTTYNIVLHKQLSEVRSNRIRLTQESVRLTQELSNLPVIHPRNMNSVDESIKKLNLLTRLRNDYNQMKDQSDHLKAELVSLKSAQQLAELAYDSILQEAGTCPTCHQQIGAHHRTH